MPGITLYSDHVSTRGGHNAPQFKSRLHSSGDSTKASVLGCTRSHNYRRKSGPTPVASVSSSEDSQQPAQHTTARITNFGLTLRTKPTGDVSMIEPFYTTCLDPKKLRIRDSGVVLPPNGQLDTHKNTENTLVANAEKARPEAHYLRTEVACFWPPRRTNTELSMVPAARPLSRRKTQSRSQLHLSDVALHVLMVGSVKSTGLRRPVPRMRDCERPLATMVIHYFDAANLVLVLCTLSKYSKASIDWDKGMSNLSAKVPSLRNTTPSLPFDSTTVLLDEHITRLQLPAYSEIDTSPKREHAPGHGKPPASTGQKRHKTNHEAPGKGRKRPRPDNGGGSTKGNDGEEDDDDGGDERRINQPNPGESLLDQDGRLFGCPFYKKDPFTHRFCLFRQTLTGTNYVRQHLRRHHLPPMHCPTCGSEFGLQSDLDGHIRQRTCEMRNFSHPGLSQVQREALEKNMPRNYPPEERWYKMWDIIFPDDPRPPSPYVKDPWAEVVENNFDIWFEQGGPERIHGRGGPTMLRPDPVVRGLESDGTTSPAEMWQAVKTDMIESADQLVRPRAEPGNHATNQQPEQLLLPDSPSGYDMVSRYNSTSSAQIQAGPVNISVPRRGPGYPSDFLTHAYIAADSDYYDPQTTGSTSGLETFYGTGGSTTRGTRPAQSQVPRLQFQYQQLLSDAYSGIPAGQSFHHAHQGSFDVGAYDTTPALDPAFNGQLSGQASHMARSFSHNSAPDLALLRGMRGGAGGMMSENAGGLLDDASGVQRAVPRAVQGGMLDGSPGPGGAGDEGFEGLGLFGYGAPPM